MAVPYAYIYRNLWVRKLTTILTAGGMALVIFVFTVVQMMNAGIRATMVATGSPDNLVMIRQGSQTEVQSGVYRDQAALLEGLPQLAIDAHGERMISKEAVILYGLTKKGATQPTNVVVRGTGPMGLQLRPQLKLIAGRLFRPGSTEIIVGKNLAKGFDGADLGQTLSFAQRDWTVVGVFDAGNSAFSSEIWGDAEQMMQSFRRPNFSVVVLKVNDPNAIDAATAWIANDPRLTLDVKTETQFYADQSEAMTKFIGVLGTSLSIIFSIGAMIGAAITMYASVANRVAEIGTLRALGFRRRQVLLAFLLESLFLSGVGWVIGFMAAASLSWMSVSTMNWQTFSEVSFQLKLAPHIVLTSFLFAMVMGLIGGVLPAVKASRLAIVDALRAA